MTEYTSMRIKKPTIRELAKVGSKSDSYDDIIRMLLQYYDESITFD